MKPILVILPLASFLPLSSPAQPTVSRLQNNYSYVLPGLPNYGIAQGSIFDIFGTGLASSTSGLQSAPLSDNLNGVTVTVTVGTVTTHPLLYYVSPTQIAAILPSTTPVGTGQITVSADGQTSKVAPIQVVRSAFGILTKDGTGGGGAAATDLNGQSLNSANSANSGDYITLWGSGLGPAAGNDALTPVPADLAAIPVEVEIGGVPAQVQYHGRSGFPGLDQINLLIPKGVLGGCNVSVVVRTGDVVSNFATVPVADSGRFCVDPPSLSATNTTPQLPATTQAGISLSHSIRTTNPLVIDGATVFPGGTTTYETASASFVHYPAFTPPVGSGNSGSGVSIGSCSVYSFDSSIHTGSVTTVVPTYLDAGKSLSVTSSLGSASVAYQNGFYGGSIGGSIIPGATALPLILPINGGTVYVANGAGGPDVGAFSVDVTFSTSLSWTNQDSVAKIDRSAPLVINWTGGQPGIPVLIGGTSIVVRPDGSTLGASFSCTAAVEAKSFTIPQSVLLALPDSVSMAKVSGITFTAPSNLQLSNRWARSFSLPGFDYASIVASTSVQKEVTFQ